MKARNIYLLILLVMSIVAHAQQRIIGGSTANITERPYQAAVFVDGDFEGGGVIISNRWILTAAHVVDGHSYSDIEVYFGSTNLNNASSVTARRVIIHEDYNDDLQTQDIALIELSSPISFSSTRQAIPLSTETNFARGTVATVSGWGRRVGSDPNSQSLSQLYKSNVTIQSCTGNEITTSGAIAHRGDSGGPLTISTSDGDVLIGLVQSVNESNNTNRFTTVGAYLDDFIFKNDIYADAIQGPDVVCSTATYTISPLPNNAEIDLSPNLTLVSQSGGTLNVRKNGDGSSFISMSIGSNTVARKDFWAGAPIIAGVSYDGSYLHALSAGAADAGITYTEWYIGSNMFTTYSDAIYCPYSSGTYNVSVTARNSCGTSQPYQTQITLARSSRYAISLLARQITVSPVRDEENTGNLQLLEAPSSPTMNYTLVNLNSGIIATNGSISSEGGTLDFSTVPAGLYVLKLFTPDGAEETFKVQLK